MVITRQLIHHSTIIEEPDGTKYTKTQLINLINKCHKLFIKLGLRRGDRIAINDFQTIEHFALMFCAFERGVVIVTIPRATLIKDNLEEFDYVAMKVKVIFEGRWIEDPCEWNVKKVSTYEIYNSYSGLEKISVLPHYDIMMSQTSGSTGKPKKFLHSHNGIYQAVTTAAKLYYKRGDKVLLYSSLNHMGIFTMQILPVLIAGCHVHTHSVFDGNVLFEQFIKHKPNKLVLFPQNTAEMQKLQEWENCDLSFVDEIISGGGSLPMRFCKELFDKGVKVIHNVYGMSETLPPMFTYAVTKDNQNIWNADHGVKMGQLVSDWQIKIVDNILYAKGSTSAYGYDIDKLKDSDGFYRTGDEIRLIDGEHWIKGRTDKTVRRDDVLVSLTTIRNRVMVIDGIDSVIAHLIDNRVVLGIVGQLPNIDELNKILTTELGQQYYVDQIVQAQSLNEPDQIKEITKLLLT